MKTKVIITDKEALQSLSLDQVVAYLRSKGAHVADPIPNGSAVWVYGKQLLLVPYSQRFADYAHRISDLLTDIEQVEGRSQVEIFEDIRAAVAQQQE